MFPHYRGAIFLYQKCRNAIFLLENAFAGVPQPRRYWPQLKRRFGTIWNLVPQIRPPCWRTAAALKKSTLKMHFQDWKCIFDSFVHLNKFFRCEPNAECEKWSLFGRSTQRNYPSVLLLLPALKNITDSKESTRLSVSLNLSTVRVTTTIRHHTVPQNCFFHISAT